MATEIPLTATHYSLIIKELNALVIDVAIETEKHLYFLYVMTYNQCKMDKKSLIENVYNKVGDCATRLWRLLSYGE